MSYQAICSAVALSCLAVGVGCQPSTPTQPVQEKSPVADDAGKATPAPNKTPQAPVAQTTPAQEEDTKEPSEDRMQSPDVEGVPALFDPLAVGAKGVAWKGRLAAIGFNSKGLRQHTKAKDYAKASAFYVKALKNDPSHIVARYNLACALALQGDKERAIGLLNQLRALDCGQCRVRLLAARSDDDFTSLREEPAFKQAVSGELSVDTQALKEATVMAHKRLSTFVAYEQVYAYEDLNALVHPKRTYTIALWDGAKIGPHWIESGAAGDLFFVGDVGRGIGWLSPRYGSPEGMTCKGTCCTPETPPMGSRALQKVCYWVTSSGQFYLDKVSLRDHAR